MVAASNALPTCPPKGKVRLPGEVHLWHAAIPVAKICLVYVANVQPQTLVGVPNRPVVRTPKKNIPRRESGTINQW